MMRSKRNPFPLFRRRCTARARRWDTHEQESQTGCGVVVAPCRHALGVTRFLQRMPSGGLQVAVVRRDHDVHHPQPRVRESIFARRVCFPVASNCWFTAAPLASGYRPDVETRARDGVDFVGSCMVRGCGRTLEDHDLGDCMSGVKSVNTRP